MIARRHGTDKYIIKQSKDVIKSKYDYEMPVGFLGGLIKDSDIPDDEIIRLARNERFPEKCGLLSTRQAHLLLDNWLKRFERKNCELAFVCRNAENGSLCCKCLWK